MDYKLEVQYELSTVGQENMLRDGKGLERMRVVTKDVTHIEASELVESGLFKIDRDGGIVLEQGVMYDTKGFEICNRGCRHFIEPLYNDPKYYQFDGELSFDELVGFLKNKQAENQAKVKDLEPELDRVTVEYKKRIAEREAEETEREAKIKAEQAEREAKREAEKAERKAWVDQFGTEYLRDCEECGYDCQREYVIRRAEREYPAFTADFNNTANWYDRSTPSHTALKELKKLIADGVDAEIVWLTEKPTNLEDDDADAEVFDSCEAIVIKSYLGKYVLVKY